MCLALIPAYAGSTWPRLSGTTKSTAHPRLRGEHLPVTSVSSQVRGLIPAYAGSTSPSSRCSWVSWAHPRLRGEHVSRDVQANLTEGSSPLTRGALVEKFKAGLDWRLIPAYAGSTRSSSVGKASRSAHPRLRGEYAAVGDGAGCEVGSSPLTRGVLRSRTYFLSSSGLILAYAGSTIYQRQQREHCAAHPCLRGEYRAA